MRVASAKGGKGEGREEEPKEEEGRKGLHRAEGKGLT